MESKKFKNSIKRIFSMVLVAAVLMTGVLGQTETTHAQVYKWMATAQTLKSGQTYRGMAKPGRNGWDYENYFYVYLPARMNVNLNIREKGTKHFDWVEVYNSSGTRVKFLTGNWKYERNTACSVCNEKMILNKGGYYIRLHEYYNAVWGENLTQSYSVKLTGTFTATTKITAVKKISKKNLKLTWNRIGGVSGYEVFRSTSSKGSYKKIATVSGTTYTNRNLSRNRNYYYKVRAYKKIGNVKYYTSFSAAKKARL